MDIPNTQKNSQDWHPADIKAALEKSGWSLRRLSRHHGYSEGAMALSLKPRYTNSKIERFVAEAIGKQPQDIWPSRYNADGTRKSKRRGNPNWIPGVPRKSSKEADFCPVKHRKAA